MEAVVQEDLDKVKGFGAKTINKIAPEVTIGGQPPGRQIWPAWVCPVR